MLTHLISHMKIMRQEADYTLNASELSTHINELTAALKQSDASAQTLDELQELLRALESLKECMEYRPLQRSNEGERAWLHDFRNHLSAAKGYAELILEDDLSHQTSLLNFIEKLLAFVQQLNDTLPDNGISMVETSHSYNALLEHHTGTILIVEDHRESRTLLTRVLRGEGHTALEASSASRAFEQLNTHEIELVLLDLMLPDQNGFEILQQLKKNAATRSIPVIVISGQTEKDEAIRCIQAGAEDYLLKPVNQVLLKARITACLERKSWRDREQQYLNELARSHAFIRKTFGRYVSAEIVDKLLEDPHGLDLGGRLQDVSILMTDICGFSPLCNELSPQQVVLLLNNYLGTLSELILSHQGTIDEFIGDAILAIFGTPLPMEDSADRAVACAIELQLAMQVVNDKNDRDGLPRITTSIAINTGQVIAGNIGSERRSKFAVVGHPVNMTARIEEITQSEQILISQSTLDALKSPVSVGTARELMAKGCSEPIVVYDLPYRHNIQKNHKHPTAKLTAKV